MVKIYDYCENESFINILNRKLTVYVNICSQVRGNPPARKQFQRNKSTLFYICLTVGLSVRKIIRSI